MPDHRDVLASLARVNPEDPEGNCALFGERFNKAWKLFKENRVKKYVFKPSGRIVWIVVGGGGEYALYPAVGYCQCEDFFFSVMKGKALACQHLIAQGLAESLGWYDTIDESDQLFSTLIEWKNHLRCSGRCGRRLSKRGHPTPGGRPSTNEEGY